MTTNQDGTQRASLDNASPNTISDQLRLIAIGSLLQGQLPQVRRMVVPTLAAANSNVGHLPTVAGSLFNSIPLPPTGKARSITHAYVRTVSANAVFGSLTPVAYAAGSHPATGEIAVAPNGDIIFPAGDDATLMDVEYLPLRGDTVTAVFPVVTGVLTLPAGLRAQGVVLLAGATILAGTTPADVSVVKYVDTSNGLPATLTACLNHDKTKVLFNNTTDAVTRASITLVMVAKQDLCAILEGSATTL